jgi:hypothetical protein
MPAVGMNAFISKMRQHRDLQRQSRFSVEFPFGIPGHKNIDIDNLSYKCESVEVPGRSFNTFDFRTYGPVTRFPIQSFFGDLTCTFFCTGGVGETPITGMIEKRIFEDWMNYINPYPGERIRTEAPYHNFKYKDQYAKDIKIKCYDVGSILSYQLNVINAFPIAISPVAMSWSSEEAARISVTFSYDYFNFAFQYDDFDGTRSGSITTQAPRMSSAELQSARAELTELTNRAEQRNTARLINQGGTP